MTPKFASASRTVIGLEIHVQLHTQSKLFCACSTAASEPNSSVCPICLGHPGTKPVLNRKAVEFAVRIALALNAKVNESFWFSRKTYFYPDLAKNFQVTQYELPLGQNGFLVLDSGKKVGISRLQLEEDPAALVHEKGFTLVDYNRSGIPLVEIVTNPDLSSPQEAREFLNKLWNLLGFLNVFVPGIDTLKADCNLSIAGNSKVEIKNVSGFQAAEKALVAEEKRQLELLKQGEEIRQQTRGFDEKSNRTLLQREKETEADYGYIFEPDLVETRLDPQWLSEIKKSIPELPAGKAKRFQKEFQLSPYDASVICSNKTLSDLFEELVKTVSPDLTARFLSRELLGILNLNKLEIESVDLKSSHLSDLLGLIRTKKVSEKNAKLATIEYVLRQVPPRAFLEKNSLLIDLGESDLDKAVSEVLAANSSVIPALAKKDPKILNFVLGQVMRKTRGKADAREVQARIEKMLKKK